MFTNLASIYGKNIINSQRGDMDAMETLHNWPELLDELKNKESISSDSKLAALLGVTRGYICAVRKERKGISLDLAKKILSRLGKTFEVEAIETLFIPQKVRRHRENIAVIRRQVIWRANEHCQLCGKEAPFIGPDGLPYLELHRVVPVNEGGRDDVSNLVALCPNCHKLAEICHDSECHEKLKKLVSKYTEVYAAGIHL